MPTCNWTVQSQPLLFALVIAATFFIVFRTVEFYVKLRHLQSRVHRSRVELEQSRYSSGGTTSSSPSMSASEFKREQDANIVGKLSLLCLIFYTVGGLFFTFSFIACDANNLVASLGFLLSETGHLCLLLVFCVRLQKSFKDTPFALFRGFTCYVGFVVITTLIVGTFNFVDRTFDSSATDRRAGGFGALILIFLICNALLLLAFFVLKLSRVISVFIANFGYISDADLEQLNRSVSLNGADRAADFATLDLGHAASGRVGNVGNVGQIGSDAGMEAEQQRVRDVRSLARLLSDMTKYTILVGLGNVSTLLFVVCVVVLVVGLGLSRVYVLFVFLLDSNVNAFCLVMQFEFYKRRYKELCTRNHLRCETWFTHGTNRRNKKTGIRLGRVDTGELVINVENNNNSDGMAANDANINATTRTTSSSDRSGNGVIGKGGNDGDSIVSTSISIVAGKMQF